MIRQGLLVFENNSRSAQRMASRVAGLSLLDRMVRTLARAGIEHLVVVAPAGAPRELSRLARQLRMQVEFLDWGAAPPASLTFGEGLLVLMGEYVHHHASLRELLRGGLEGCELVAQVSEAPPQPGPFRQVRLEEGRAAFALAETGAGASSGAFLCAPRLFSLAGLLAARDAWNFLSARARGRKVALRCAAAPLWRRVEDRRGARAAKDMLFSQVTKATSGFISRHLNARFSIPTSKLLIETGISPHMVTVLLVLTTGLSSAYLISRPGEYVFLALAGILWQLAAIFDRCDGEIARVKLCESKFGAWFDTITDNIAYLCGYVGLLVGMHSRYPGSPLYLYLGISAIAALLLTLVIMYSYALRTGSGSLQHYLVGFSRHVPDDQKGAVYKFMERYGALAKRDSFSFVYFLAALANWFDFMYWFTVIGLHGIALGVLISQHKMLQGYRAGLEQRAAENRP